jgi:hypothetical protein
MSEKKPVPVQVPLKEGAPINPMQKIPPSDAGLGQKIAPMQKTGGQSGGNTQGGAGGKPSK